MRLRVRAKQSQGMWPKTYKLQHTVETLEQMSLAHLQSVDFEGADLSNALLVEVEVA